MRRTGHTLLELLVALALAGGILAAIGHLVRTVVQTQRSLAARVRARDDHAIAFEHVQRDVGRLIEPGSTSIPSLVSDTEAITLTLATLALHDDGTTAPHVALLPSLVRYVAVREAGVWTLRREVQVLTAPEPARVPALVPGAPRPMAVIARGLTEVVFEVLAGSEWTRTWPGPAEPQPLRAVHLRGTWSDGTIRAGTYWLEDAGP